MSTSGNPNILLIIADDLGQDVVDVSGSGATRKMEVITFDGAGTKVIGQLPNVSLLLRHGLYFRQAWAQPACSPTRASIYTGLHPWKSGIGSPMNNPQLATSAVTSLPLVLPETYACGLFGKWHLGDKRGTRPTAHGWDKHVGTLGGVVPNYYDWTKNDSADYPNTQPSTVYATEDTINEAGKWIHQRDPEKPWFVTIAFHAPHSPFDDFPPGNTYSLPAGGPAIVPNERYTFNAMAQAMDFYIGQLLGLPAPVNWAMPVEQLQNTLIIFIGDNGSDEDIAVEEPKTTIYEGGVRAPFLISDGQAVVQAKQGKEVSPRFLAADKLNTISNHLVHVVDLYKTIAEVANARGRLIPENIDSQSLTRFFMETGQQESVRLHNFSQYYFDRSQTGETVRLATIRNNSYKLNYSSEASAPYQLFQYTQNKVGMGIGIEIPGREDDENAADLYVDAITGKNKIAAKNLEALVGELQAYYQADDQGSTFPDLQDLPR